MVDDDKIEVSIFREKAAEGEGRRERGDKVRPYNICFRLLGLPPFKDNQGWYEKHMITGTFPAWR